jgi:hypothetical protein
VNIIRWIPAGLFGVFLALVAVQIALCETIGRQLPLPLTLCSHAPTCEELAVEAGYDACADDRRGEREAPF